MFPDLANLSRLGSPEVDSPLLFTIGARSEAA